MGSDDPSNISETGGTSDFTRSTSGDDANHVDALGDHTTRLVTTDPASHFTECEVLPGSLVDSRVIGLGEGTHGTREFFRLKHRLIRHLVTECGHRAVCFEASFAESIAIDEYVRDGVGTPREALAGVKLWPWYVREVEALLEWLRDFNRGRQPADRVRFFGADAQYTSGSIARLRAFFDRVDPGANAALCAELDVLDDEGVPATPAADHPIDFERAPDAIAAVRDRLEGTQAAYCRASSREAWEVAMRHLTVIEAAVDHRRDLAALDAAAMDDPAVRERLIAHRDRVMADTVEWLLDTQIDDLVVWAHDAHVNREKQVIRGTDIAAPSLGAHLADRYGSDYYALGFAFGRGSFQAMSQVERDEPVAGAADADDTSDSTASRYDLRKHEVAGPLPETIEAVFERLGHRLALVDLRGAREDDRLTDWLATPHKRFSVGATFDPETDPAQYLTSYRFGDAFDGICFIDETSRARPLDGE